MTNEGQNLPEVHRPQPLTEEESAAMRGSYNTMPSDTAEFWYDQGSREREEARLRRSEGSSHDSAIDPSGESSNLSGSEPDFLRSSLSPESYPSNLNSSEPESRVDPEKIGIIQRSRDIGETALGYVVEAGSSIKTGAKSLADSMNRRWQTRSDELIERRADYRDRHGEDLWAVGSTVLDPDMSRKAGEAQRESAKELLEIGKDIGQTGMNKIQERWDSRAEENPIAWRSSERPESSNEGPSIKERFEKAKRNVGVTAAAAMMMFAPKREETSTRPSEPDEESSLDELLLPRSTPETSTSTADKKSLREAAREKWAKLGVITEMNWQKLSPKARERIIIGLKIAPLVIPSLGLLSASVPLEGIDDTVPSAIGDRTKDDASLDSGEPYVIDLPSLNGVEVDDNAGGAAETIHGFDIEKGDGVWKVAEDLGVEPNDPNVINALSSDEAAVIFKDAGIDTYKMDDGNLGLQNTGEIDSNHATDLRELVEEKLKASTDAAQTGIESGADQTAGEQEAGAIDQQDKDLAQEHGFTESQLQEGLKIEVKSGDSIAAIAKEHNFNQDQITQLTEYITKNHTEGVEYYNFVDTNGNTEVRLVEGVELKLTPDQLRNLINM